MSRGFKEAKARRTHERTTDDIPAKEDRGDTAGLTRIFQEKSSIWDEGARTAAALSLAKIKGRAALPLFLPLLDGDPLHHRIAESVLPACDPRWEGTEEAARFFEGQKQILRSGAFEEKVSAIYALASHPDHGHVRILADIVADGSDLKLSCAAMTAFTYSVKRGSSKRTPLVCDEALFACLAGHYIEFRVRNNTEYRDFFKDLFDAFSPGWMRSREFHSILTSRLEAISSDENRPAYVRKNAREWSPGG